MLIVGLDGFAEFLPADGELCPAVRVLGLVALDIDNGDSIFFNPGMRNEIINTDKSDKNYK